MSAWREVRGWHVVGTWLLVALLLGAGCKQSADEVPGSVDPSRGARLGLYDDFSGAALDERARWAPSGYLRREVVGGALHLDAAVIHAESPEVDGVSNRIRVAASGRVDAFAAEIVVEDYEAIGCEARSVIGLHFQDPSERGTDQGLVVIRIGVRAVASTTLRKQVMSFRCEDPACAQDVPFPEWVGDLPHNVDVLLGTPLRLAIAYLSDEDAFEIAFDDESARVAASAIPGFDPAHFDFAEVRTQVRGAGDPGDACRLATRVTEVSVNGEVYDDFSGEVLDPTRWDVGGWVRAVEDGALVLDASHTGGARSFAVPMRHHRGVREVAATARIEASDSGGWSAPALRVGGAWYAEEQGGAGGLFGTVYGYTVLTRDEVRWQVFRCAAFDCGVVDRVHGGTLRETEAGASHMLYAGFNGALFTFQVDDDAPVSFDPVAAGSVPARAAPLESSLGLSLRFDSTPSGVARLRAVVDDVRAGPLPRVSMAGVDGEQTWRMEASEGGGFASFAGLGRDPDDRGTMVLRALAGDACGDDCRALEVRFPVAEGTLPAIGQTRTVTAARYDDGAGGLYEGGGTLTFTRLDAGRGSEGRFVLNLGGREVNGTFAVPTAAYIAAPHDAGTADWPIELAGGCVEWPFCNFAAPGGRTTSFEAPVTPSRGYIVRSLDADATVTVRDPDGTVLCADSGTAAVEAACRFTPTEGWVTIEVEVGPGPRARIPIHVAHTDLPIDASLQSFAVSAEEGAWFRVRHAGGPLMGLVYPPDRASGYIEAWRGSGRLGLYGGWCCEEGAAHGIYLSEPDAGTDAWFRLQPDEAGTYLFGVDEAAPGTVGDPIDHVVPEAHNTFNHAYRAGEVVHVAFEAPLSGLYDVGTTSRDDQRVQPQVGWTLTRADGSPVAHTGGARCEARFLDEGWYEGRCYTMLEAGARYRVALRDDSGVAYRGVADLRVYPPWEDATPLAVGETVEHTLQPGVSQVFGAVVAAERAVRLEVETLGFASLAFDIQGYVGGSAGPWDALDGEAQRLAWRVPGDVLAGVARLAVDNASTTDAVSVRIRLVQTGSGDASDDPFEVESVEREAVRDALPFGGARHFAFTPDRAGSWSIEVRSQPSASVMRGPVDWVLYTDPADPGGSQIASATSTQVEDRFIAVSSVTLGADAPVYLRADSRASGEVYYEVALSGP